MTTNVKVEDLVLEFKRSGRFDEIRKQLLDEFSSSPSGQQLYTSLCRLASETETSSKPGLIGALGKSALFNNTSRNQIGQELLISPKFREKVEGQLKSTFYELKKSAPPAAVSTAPAPTVAKDPEPKVIEAKEEINVDLFLAEIEMSNAMSAGMALNSKKLKLKKAQASTTKSPQILPSEPAPETSTQAEAEADTEMSVELPPVTVASAESQQPGEEMQLDEISEAQNIDSSIDPASYRSVNIEQDSSKLTEAEPPVVTPTKSIEADDSGKNDSKSTGKEGKSRFKVGEEYACLIPGDTVRYFNVILRTADLIKNVLFSILK